MPRMPMRVARGTSATSSATPRSSSNLVVLPLVFFVARQCEGDDCISELAAVRIHEVEVVSIGHISAKHVDDELAPIGDIGDRGRGGATDVGDATSSRSE